MIQIMKTLSRHFNAAVIILIFVFAQVQLMGQQKDSLQVFFKCRNDISMSQLFNTMISTKNGIGLKGARLIENKNNDQIAIIPDSAVVIVELKKSGQVINRSVLDSRKPPRPIFEVMINGKSYNSLYPTVEGPLPSSISITPVSDESFRMMVPKDAVYKILKWEVSLIRNGQTIGRNESRQAPMTNSDLAQIRSVARPNDILQIKVLNIMRQNAVGEMINQELTDYTISYKIK